MTITDPNAVRRDLDVDVPAEVEAVADRLADPLFVAHVLAVLCERCPEVVSAVIDDLEAAWRVLHRPGTAEYPWTRVVNSATDRVECGPRGGGP